MQDTTKDSEIQIGLALSYSIESLSLILQMELNNAYLELTKIDLSALDDTQTEYLMRYAAGIKRCVNSDIIANDLAFFMQGLQNKRSVSNRIAKINVTIDAIRSAIDDLPYRSVMDPSNKVIGDWASSLGEYRKELSMMADGANAEILSDVLVLLRKVTGIHDELLSDVFSYTAAVKRQERKS